MAKHILLVEDDTEQALLFSLVLRMVGYTVETMDSAEEAQVRLAAEPFALLLADWDLAGGMQGDELIRWSKAHNPGIKTILFSNHPQVNEIAAACGADAAFQKTDGITRLRQLSPISSPNPSITPDPQGLSRLSGTRSGRLPIIREHAQRDCPLV